MGVISFTKSNNNNSTSVYETETPYITSNKISATGIVKHGFSTRIGGVSTGIFSSLNLGFSRGDDYENVIENHKRIAEAIGFDYREIVTSKQTHTTNIKIVKSDDKGKGIITERDYTDIDGFITNVPGVPLVTYYADCVPLFFVDTENKAIGLSHSGWRGTVNRMGEKTIKAMESEYGTKPENIVAFIGPSICGECYEIGEDVADYFKNEFSPEEQGLLLKEQGDGKYLLDLWKTNEIIMKNAGVKPENIDVTDICTCCNSDLLFSHRASNGERGSLGAFITII